MESILVAVDIAEKLIFVLLVGLSIWSVAIIFEKKRNLNKENLLTSKDAKIAIQEAVDRKSQSASFTSDQKKDLPGLLPQVMNLCLVHHGDKESLDLKTSLVVREHRITLENGMAVLATLGANAPFIGLLGTVLGIMRAFANLGSQSGSQAVMSGVSQALLATAMGLFVAIPAVVAFNWLSYRNKKLITEAELLRDFYWSTSKAKGQ